MPHIPVVHNAQYYSLPQFHPRPRFTAAHLHSAFFQACSLKFKHWTPVHLSLGEAAIYIHHYASEINCGSLLFISSQLGPQSFSVEWAFAKLKIRKALKWGLPSLTLSTKRHRPPKNHSFQQKAHYLGHDLLQASSYSLINCLQGHPQLP